MAGTWTGNIVLGFVGFIVVFISAYTNNSFMTSLIRGSVSFVLFYLFAFLIRWVIHFIMSDTKGHINVNSVEIRHHIKGAHETLTVEEMQRSLETLNEEEIKLASRYIKDLLKKDVSD